MKIDRTPLFDKKMEYYAQRNNRIFKKTVKTVALFGSQPNQPSLRLHKLTGRLHNYFSISVDKSIRIILVKLHDRWMLLDIGTHDEVYRED